MIKLLHSADWHLDAPLAGRTREQAACLRRALLALPDRIAAIAKAEGCDLVLLSGDLFDGPGTPESAAVLRRALEEMVVPVFIAPGNHDYMAPDSVWSRELWPENVHIFSKGRMESVALPGLDCRVYGAAFTAMEAPALLKDFRAECQERYAIGVLHGDATQAHSPYCAVSSEQVRESGLDYLALGHIHKGGSFVSGSTLCAWPGCPQGRGYDETGDKGVLIVTLEETAQTRFVPVGDPRFFDLETAVQALESVLPPVAADDFYRVTLTGESEPLELEELSARFSHVPNLELRDRTVQPLDIWGSAGEDTLEGLYFGLLRAAMEEQGEDTARQILLAARISRQLLNGQEVALP